ncbi:MAG: outer membrane beta-barrel protein [Vicinamibacterales bacterium]
MSLRKLIITSGLAFMVVAAVPTKASADWLFTPFVGMNFGGGFSDDFGDFEDEFENRGTYGASLAWVGGGALGFELDFGFSPNFFENTAGDADFDYGENNVTTLMANVVLGAPGGGIRPYASGGAGIIRSRIDGADDFFDVSSNDWGFNLGAGLTGFFTDNLGVRGDVRYFRSLADDEPDDDFDVSLGSFKFWRGTVGLTFRF